MPATFSMYYALNILGEHCHPDVVSGLFHHDHLHYSLTHSCTQNLHLLFVYVAFVQNYVKTASFNSFVHI